jgi:hypothetical protein
VVNITVLTRVAGDDNLLPARAYGGPRLLLQWALPRLNLRWSGSIDTGMLTYFLRLDKASTGTPGFSSGQHDAALLLIKTGSR